jgi:hypothetical protein
MWVYPSARKVPTKVPTLSKLAGWSREWVWRMKLTRNQSQKLLHERGIWITEACDKCGRLLGFVRWNRRGEPGEWCSTECRDGIRVFLKANTRCCRECGVSLDGKRSDSEFCSDVHRKRFAKSATSQNRRFIAETPIGKQGLTKAENGKSTDTLNPRSEALETAICTNFIFAKEA